MVAMDAIPLVLSALAAWLLYRDYRRGVEVDQLKHAIQQIYLHNSHLRRPTRTIPFEFDSDTKEDD